MRALKHATTVERGGRIVVVDKGLKHGTLVEVIVLVKDPQEETADLLTASETSLAFWDNEVDDEVWNEA